MRQGIPILENTRKSTFALLRYEDITKRNAINRNYANRCRNLGSDNRSISLDNSHIYSYMQFMIENAL